MSHAAGRLPCVSLLQFFENKPLNLRCSYISEAITRRKRAIEKAGGGSEFGQGRVAIGNPKKRMELAVLKAAVGQVREEYAGVVDAYTRECLALEVDTSFASRRVTRVLEGIVAERGMPQAIRCDNGPELTSRHFLVWCIDRKIELVHIQPGRPMQNGRVESYNGRMREECLNVSWFGNLFEARGKIEVWRRI